MTKSITNCNSNIFEWNRMLGLKVFKMHPGPKFEETRRCLKAYRLYHTYHAVFEWTSVLNYNNLTVYAGSSFPANLLKDKCKFLNTDRNPDSDSLIRNIFSWGSVLQLQWISSVYNFHAWQISTKIYFASLQWLC